MMFSSRPPFNDDPAPYVVTLTKRTPFSNPMTTGSVDEFLREDERVHDPRPQYERPQHNPTNPILVYARKHPDANILWAYLPFRPTDEMIAHARKVLSRRHDPRIAAEVEALFSKES